jgi:hypothetical protein
VATAAEIPPIGPSRRQRPIGSGASPAYWARVLASLQVALVLGWIVAARVAGPGLDTDNYVHLFKAPPALADGVSRFEPLFLMLVAALRAVIASPDVLFFAIAGLACLVKLLAISRLPDASLAVFVVAYVAICMPFYEYNQIRVAIAVAFVYLAWNHLYQSPARSALHFAVAIGFHYSVVLFIVPAALVLAARSRVATAATVAGVFAFGIASAIFEAPPVLQSYATGLLLRAAEIEDQQVNLLGFGILLVAGSTVVLAFCRFELKAYILSLCTLGMLVFVALVKLELPYALRVIETVSAALPYAWARAFGGAAWQRIAVGTLVAASVAYAPIQWARLG